MDTPQIQGTEDTAVTVGVLRRIWKYKLHYIIIIPAMLLLFFFKILPLITSMVIAFKNYSIFRGLSGSPWVGMANFSKLFASPEFRNALANTLIIKLEYVAVSGIIALVVALVVSGIKSFKLRSLIQTLVLIPYFIPSVAVAYVLYFMLAPNQLEKLHLHVFILGEPQLFRPMLVIVEALKTCAIPILMALAAIGSKHAISQIRKL
ncbi:hypothetical protein [Paenibacillus sedimenti]|uniref:ABC transmembrane type-1 domain-containing protein n=1 Tax=Paenibacillus sedimenti TaxID=2770274 RepID=A0A926QJW2_9BACL|nr:hypothetical protein [Paenibacillus sedimenti]MBD0380874.1 hypothetical protein [Paenibacillus sedimenti]